MRHRPIIHVIALLAGGLLFAGPAPAAAKPNVVLITIDTARADRMGFLGSTRGLTPNLDALSKESVVFVRAYSQVPLTNPSHATILTGTYPQFHHINDFAIPLTADLPDLPETLHKAGYATAAFVGASILNPKSTAPGFDRGFDTYDADTGERRVGSAVIERATVWIKAHKSQPFFVWIHLYDAHSPYEPPEPYASKYASEPYDGGIAYDDTVIGDLLKQLKSLALFDQTLLAIMSDHGESLGQHGERQHGYFLYDETIHVPLLFKLPAARRGGTRVNMRAGLVDVAPTILQILGLTIPLAMQGQPLLSAMESDVPAAERTIYSGTDYPYLAFGWSPLHSLRANQFLFIDAPHKELYDETADAYAEHNLSAGAPAVTDTLTASLQSFRKKTSNASAVPKAILDAQEVKKLNALGYVSTGNIAPEKSAGELRADPKDKIEVANRVTDALRDISLNHYDQALPLLEYAIEHDPESAAVNRLFGECEMHLHNYKDAEAPLRKALQLGSDLPIVHFQLGMTLFSLENFAAAETEFHTAITKSPNWPDAHYWLATTYSRTKRLPQAERELNTALTLQPNSFPAVMELGQVLLLEHEPEKAVAVFQKAAKLDPTIGDPHHFLARAYTELGRDDDAKREDAESIRLSGSTN